mgnify:CR=1 FL=1
MFTLRSKTFDINFRYNYSLLSEMFYVFVTLKEENIIEYLRTEYLGKIFDPKRDEQISK